METRVAGGSVTHHERRCGLFPGAGQVSVHNEYGPTEATIISTTWKCPRQPTSISIGKAIDNSRALVLNDQFEQVKPGEVGELCMAGSLLAEGYINKPEETAKRFK